MKIKLIIISFVIITTILKPQENNQDERQLLKTDRKKFVENLIGNMTNDYSKAQKIVKWVVRNFDWTATDYQKRTVEQIIERGGGNCNELAMVTKSLLNESGIRTRTVREINIHTESTDRQIRAEEKVISNGNKLSVFGKNHNDHVWLEVYDDESKSYQPIDPTLGVAGIKEWIEARMIYSERNLIAPNGYDMIVPIAIFASDEKGKLIENRSSYYLINEFDNYYKSNLSKSTYWKDWEKGIDSISEKCKDAFNGTYNLHQSSDKIIDLKNIYYKLKNILTDH